MAENTATDENASPPPPPPPGAPVGRPPLRRSRTDRVIGGVAGGIGRYFDIDPVLVRIGFVVLTVFGGSGVLLYLIGWLVIAQEGEVDSAALQALRGHERRSSRGLIAIALIIGGLLIVSPFVWATGAIFGEGLVFPLLIIAAGIALLVWPEREGPPRQWSSEEDRDEVRRDLADARDELTREFDAVRSTLAGEPVPPATDAASSLPVPPVEPVEPRPPRPRPFIGPLTLAILLAFTGGAVALDQADVLEVDPAVGLAIALSIVGVALTVTAFIGRARGLIALGVLLLPVVWWFHAIDLTWWEGIGDEQIDVETIAELEDEYRHGIGRFVVDLSQVELDGETREVAIGLTIGELIVITPDDIEVVVEFDGRLGEIEVDTRRGSSIDDGFDLDLDRRIGDPEDGTLVLDVDLGIGDGLVEIR